MNQEKTRCLCFKRLRKKNRKKNNFAVHLVQKKTQALANAWSFHRYNLVCPFIPVRDVAQPTSVGGSFACSSQKSEGGDERDLPLKGMARESNQK